LPHESNEQASVKPKRSGKTRRWLSECALVVLAFGCTSAIEAATLDIYFIDVEGGQSTLIVTPQHQTLLIDAGWGDGTAASAPGAEPGRDAKRIAAAAHAAGVTKIDYLLITHFHSDHAGGVPALARLLPVGTFIDHGGFLPEDRDDPATVAMFDAYANARARGQQLQPKLGDRLPLLGIEAIVVSTDGAVIDAPLQGAGMRNAACRPAAPQGLAPNENFRSTGVVLRYGKFRFLDIGDLSGQPLYDLVCPRDLIGAVDAYLVAHHGNADTADPATFAAFRPRVAVLNNGKNKGGFKEMFLSLRNSRNVADVWQLHWSEAAGSANYGPEFIANLDERSAYWIRLRAKKDGSFTVLNGRTRIAKKYAAGPASDLRPAG
jgi:beta-lactamase superfamily II metal-dependent hydrolase